METIIIEGLQIWPEDLGKMTWDEAMAEVKELGPDWRLPTIKEFKEVLYPNRSEILEVSDKFYWSSTENVNFSSYASTFLFPYGGNVGNANKKYTGCVCAVRDFTSGVAIEYLLKDF